MARTYGTKQFDTGQVALNSSTATQIVPFRASRVAVVLVNADSQIEVAAGPSTSVTTSNGVTLEAGESIEIRSRGAVYAISASGTPTIEYIEYFE